jgi:superfamily II DNA or RNA helicase
MLLWLKGLVGPSAVVQASLPECARLHEMIAGWTSRVDSLVAQPRFVPGFRLHAPADVLPTHLTGLWRLTIHAVDREDPGRVFSAADLLKNESQSDPFPLASDPLLPRLRSELARASKYFPPLSACAAQDGPLEATLSLSEAYFFLREAAPLLKSEGYTIWTPDWWTDSAPRPRMRLSLQPADNQSSEPLGGIGINELVRYDWEVAIGEETLTREELAILAESKEPLVRLRGRWMEASQAEIDIARKFIVEQGSGSATLFEILRRCYLSDDFALGVPFGGIRAQGWISSVLDAGDASIKIGEVSPPREFHGDLRPYQLRGLQWLSFMSRIGVGGCLADDMGLGKTIQLIALLLHEKENNTSTGPTLLVGPMSLVGNWQRELERFAPSLKVLVHHGLERLTGDDFVKEASRHDVVISTYALTHRDFDQLSVVQWRRVALDEAQCIKNPAAKQAAAVRMLPTKHRLALTGTPVENRLSELWSIMDFLNPGYLGTAADFRRRMAIPIERHHDTDHAARLRTLIRPFILRRLKSDPLVQVDLPPKMEMKVFCNLTREQAALYEAVVSDMLRRVSESEGIQRRGLILATLTKLKQICNHPVQFLGDSSELAERSGKCERICEMLGEVIAEGDQALIFTQYREMGDLLVTLLKKTLDCEILFLHGGTSRVERDRLVQRFQASDNAPLLILSLKAGGFGLNLTAAAHVFHFDRWWNPAVEDQATDRAHRIGQHRTVQVHKLVCIGTLEERIDAMLEQKRQLADQIIGSGEAWLTELSTDQFRDLITLSQDAIGE